jgi:hypothetical protein
MPGPLGRITPPDFEHVEKYPIRSLTPLERPKSVPVTLGIEWFPTYDSPIKGRDGRWRVRVADGRPSRGGHAITLKPKGLEVASAWQAFYDQGDMSRPLHPVDQSGCTGYSASYAMTMLNRERYSAPWLYWQNKLNDEWPGTNYEGSSVRAAFENLRTQGHVRVHDGKEVLPADPKWGVVAYRWAKDAGEIASALGYGEGAAEVPWCNTWGRDGYPRTVWVPTDELDRHLQRWNGEACIPTDR